MMPVRGARISSPFGMRVHPVKGELREHTGVDLAAPVGTPVTAAAAGTVRFAGFDRSGYGRYVVLAHVGGYTTYYAHLSAIAAGLRVGAAVMVGQQLGAVGSTGVATGPHLHFEVRRNSEPTDPLVLTRSNAAPTLAGSDLVAFEQQTNAARQQLAVSSDSTQLAASSAHRLATGQGYAF
jgi:murein DD-endopeptidase MepM/ murein hydrolase activator NlpD